MYQLAERLVALRKTRGINQGQLALVVNVSQATVSRWEKGSFPTIEHLTKLAEFYGISIADLTGVSDPYQLEPSNQLKQALNQLLDEEDAELVSSMVFRLRSTKTGPTP